MTTWKQKLFNFLLTGVMIAGLVFLIESKGAAFGIITGISFIVLYTVILLIINRQKYFFTLNMIETKIFGKPLEKIYWKKGEFERKKFKLRLWK